MNPSVSIVVLTWNGKSLTRQCLKSLSSVEYDNYSVLVVDNGSEDGTADDLKHEFPDVAFLKLPENYGYAGGNNRGFDYLMENEPPQFVLFLNNDTLVKPQFLNHLVEGIKKFGSDNIYSPMIMYADMPDRIWYGGGHINLWTGIIRHTGIRKTASEYHPVSGKTDFVSGCCLMISSQLFRELDGFDERFNMYSEDVDLCLRARQKGSYCFVIPGAVIYHKVSATIGGNLSVNKNIRKLKSLLKLIFRHGGVLKLMSSIVSLIVLIPVQMLLYLWQSGKIKEKNT